MTTVSDFERARLRNLERSVIDEHLMPYVFEKMPQGIIRELFEGFLPFEYLNEENAQLMFEHFFIAWFLFHWKEGCKWRSKMLPLNGGE